MEWIGTLFLSVGGWLGGSPVYHDTVGVDPKSDAQPPESLDSSKRALRA